MRPCPGAPSGASRTGPRSRPVACISCAICTSTIPLSSIRTDAEAHHPRLGKHRPGQQTISCSGCGHLLHTRCVDEANTAIAGHHLWFSNMRMRAFVQERGLVGHRVAFCKGCHDVFSEQILANYKMMERFDEGARFLEDFGRYEEAGNFLARIKSQGPSFYIIARLSGRAWGMHKKVRTGCRYLKVYFQVLRKY